MSEQRSSIVVPIYRSLLYAVTMCQQGGDHKQKAKEESLVLQALACAGDDARDGIIDVVVASSSVAATRSLLPQTCASAILLSRNVLAPYFVISDMLLRGRVLHGAPPVGDLATVPSAVPTVSMGSGEESTVQPGAQPGTVVFDGSEASVLDDQAGLEGGEEDGEYVYELVLSDEWAEYFRQRAEAKRQKRGERGSDGQTSGHRGRKRGRRRGKRKRGRGKGPEAKRQKQEQQSHVSEGAHPDDSDDQEEEGGSGSEGEEVDDRVGLEGQEGVCGKREAEEGELVGRE